jgi:hypothetical protein
MLVTAAYRIGVEDVMVVGVVGAENVIFVSADMGT